MLEYLGKNWIALLSLVVSVFVLYNNYLRAFDLEVRDAGRIQLAKNPFSQGLSQPCVMLDLIFSNHGVKAGVVEDVAIALQAGGKSVMFRSLLLITDRSKNFQVQPSPPKAETFSSFELGKEESVVKQIMFVPLDSSSLASFDPVQYQAEVWVISSGNKNWNPYKSITFNVTNEDLTALAKSGAVPQPGGGYFINWITQDKPVQEAEERVQALKLKIGAK